MAERPIIFSAPMVRAMLDGRKTQTRRVLPLAHPKFSHQNVLDPDMLVDKQYVWFWDGVHDCVGASWPLPYAPGDRLWVRETWRPHYLGDGVWNLDVSYPADGERRTICDGEFGDKDWNWPKAADRGNVTPLHMPRWASRLTLTVTDVRVQRLQDISAKDSIAEGAHCRTCEAMGQSACHGRGCFASIDAYRCLWNSLHGPGAWDANPWVVALTFTVQRGNIDQMPGAK